ncbi:MAG TPA: ABC transporter permease [Ignavibacteriales bacterium]|nr:ABC transporter permease [Ignavibacteriales bacterium]
MIFRLTIIELYKIFKKWRAYIAFGAIAALVSIFHASMYFEGENYVNHLTRGISSLFFVSGNILNGYLISNIILFALNIHVPFLIAVVAGDLLAGEATGGTFRVLLTRPISRFQLASSKFLAGVTYAVLFMFFLAAITLIPGILIFGTGDLIIIGSPIVILPESDLPMRFLGAYIYASISMATVVSLAFLFSSLVENSIGPIVSTIAVIIIFYILSAIDVTFLNNIEPYMFTTYMNDWDLFFKESIDYGEILKSAGVLALNIAIFYSAALFIFLKKDILS